MKTAILRALALLLPVAIGAYLALGAAMHLLVALSHAAR